jgi:hypothetical protein
MPLPRMFFDGAAMSFFSSLRLAKPRTKIAFSVGDVARVGHTLSSVYMRNLQDVMLDTEVDRAIEEREVGTVSQGGEGTRG